MDSTSMKLFMILLGCRPENRLTEQHDIFFTIAPSLIDAVPEMQTFWREAKGKIHIDAWREVQYVDGFKVQILPRSSEDTENNERIFFINLGGYQPGEFDELHYKILVASSSLGGAIKKAKETDFYKSKGFDGAVSHVDDRFGIDVDDVYEIKDILPEHTKLKYQITLIPETGICEDPLHIGYLPIKKVV